MSQKKCGISKYEPENFDVKINENVISIESWNDEIAITYQKKPFEKTFLQTEQIS